VPRLACGLQRTGDMKPWVIALTEPVVVALDLVALLVVVLGSLEALYSLPLQVLRGTSGHERRAAWLRFARWLVAALTFQLAADIVESSISRGWEDIGRLAAVAMIRTFLNFFLDRDVEELRQRQSEAAATATASEPIPVPAATDQRSIA
jgi:uncharacterized membrane protein